MRRYRKDRAIRGGKCLATNSAIANIRQAVRNKSIATKTISTKEGERLDSLAGKYLGDARLWWILAVCSNIGWALQIPPGTEINIPTSLARIKAML
jgi:hypothetical protein